MSPLRCIVVCAAAVVLAGCGETSTLTVADGTGPNPRLPPPNPTLIPTVNIAPVHRWQDGEMPTPAPGLMVTAFASGLDHPRWLYVLPNGDVLVAESNTPKKETGFSFKQWITGKVMGKAGAGVPSADRITLLRDADGDGVAELQTVFLDHLKSPFGMALVGNDLYVANTDALLRFTYADGATHIEGTGTLVTDLPGGPINHHWTKNVIASPDGRMLYVTVGSNSNVGENGMENEAGRAAIWQVDPANGRHRIYASGLRNPNGLGWEPVTGQLWTAVNERDEIGSDLVPDYITSVKDGGFYGWPYSYYGAHVDRRVQPPRPELVATAIQPDYALGPHTATLGIAFAGGNRLPAAYASGLFAAQHGSWNGKPHSGYKVIFVPFAQGRPEGMPQDVLTGFLNEQEQARGRPVDVIVDKRGGLLVTDDVGNKVWRVTAASAGQ